MTSFDRFFLKVKKGQNSCPNLIFIGDNAVCLVYKKRPFICKIYPEVPKDREKGCGFTFEGVSSD
jgi:Fe-S-cluster containining protein